MRIFKTRWLFLTSYSIWSFMRLMTTPGPNPEAYIVYSPFASVGGTEHDETIFRAFLSLLICDDEELAAISVPPPPPPPPDPSTPQSSPRPSEDGSGTDNDGSYQQSEGSERTSQEPTRPFTRSQAAGGQSIQVSYLHTLYSHHSQFCSCSCLPLDHVLCKNHMFSKQRARLFVDRTSGLCSLGAS